jgi:glycosyltransferase involved in cell wall biosynthesis
MVKLPARWAALRWLEYQGHAYPLELQHVACVSNYVRQKLAEAGVLPYGARVIYNGIDPQPFLQVAERQSRAHDAKRLVYVGGLVTHKGVLTAIEALGLLQRKGQAEGLHLTVVGGGHPDYEARLERRVQELALNERVTFRGRVPRDEVAGILAHHDVFLFTSLYEEPIARSVMEAMAAGLAVVATPVGGQREMLEDGQNALVFPPGDAPALAQCILQLRRRPDLRARLAESGHRIVLERFTLDRMVDEMEAWLKEIVT